MSELLDLWLPILLSAIVVFIASFITWMVLPFHKADFKELPDEAGFLDTLRALKLPPAFYCFPGCSDMSKLKDPEFRKQWEAGPHGTIHICAKVPNFGRNLLLVFIFYLIVGIFVGYVGTVAYNPGADYMDVFRLTGTVAIMAHCLGIIPQAIFLGRTFKSLLLDLIDGVVYGLLTAGIFGWLWPALDMPLSIPG